jgi:hypothetical protein
MPNHGAQMTKEVEVPKDKLGLDDEAGSPQQGAALRGSPDIAS